MTTHDLSAGPLTLMVTPVPGPTGPAGPAGMGASTPGGRLTLVSGQPEMPQSADYSSTVLYYAPCESDKIPLFNGADWLAPSFTSGPLDPVGLSMAGGPAWVAGEKRDVFVTLVDGVPALCTGPAWPGDTPAARGLVRRNGIWVNAASMTCDVGLVVAANQATFVGSICPASTGLLTATFTLGQNRRCDVWNAYNQREIRLGVGCPPASPYTPVVWYPNSQYPAWQAFNNDLNNSGHYFTGMPQNVECRYRQWAFINTQTHGPGALIVTVCKDSLSNSQGGWGNMSSDTSDDFYGVTAEALFVDRGVIGSHRAFMGVSGANNFGGVVVVGLDPRTQWGDLDRSHIMWIEYQG